jgi:hypothetical protein
MIIMRKQKAKGKKEGFNFLLEEAKRLGAREAGIISPSKAAVEDCFK